MLRTPTLHAAAASLGLMAGFVMAPVEVAPLERSLAPHAVAVAWDGGPSPDLPVAGVQIDDWGGRLAPTPAPDARVEKRRRVREAERRPAPVRRREASPALRIDPKRVQRELLAHRELQRKAEHAHRELLARHEFHRKAQQAHRELANRELPRRAEEAHRDLLARRERAMRDMDRAAAAFGVERRECPRHPRHARRS
jgi:hypothetical protein